MSRIAALDKYISDDIRRHGNRLSELEKKITNVYQEFTATEALDDDALFGNEDDEEEDNAFVMYAPCFSFYQTKSLHGDTRPGDNLLTILARIFWVYASLALLPSSAFPLYRYPNVSSKARGTPKAQTLCTGYRSSLLSLLPDRIAPWLLRTSSRRTRLSPRRSAKSCSSEARPTRTGDPAEQRSHRSGSRIKEEGQAERWHGSGNKRSSNRSRRRSCYGCSNCGNSGWGICGSHVGSSDRCDSASDTRVEQRWSAEPAGGISIGCTVGYGYGGNYDFYW